MYQLETRFARIKINNLNTELCHHRPRSKAHSNEYDHNADKAEQSLPAWRGAGRSSRGTKPLLCPQLSYSLAKRLSFDRIGNLGKSSTIKARLQEEVRRVEIAQGTRVKYTEMGVFSAVAGNQLPNQLQKRELPALFHLRCPSQSHQRSARGRTRLTTVTSISCRSF